MIVKCWYRIMPRSLGRRKVTWYPMSVLAWASQEHGDLCKVCPLQKELLELFYLKGNCQPLYSMGGTWLKGLAGICTIQEMKFAMLTVMWDIKHP